MVSVDPRGVEVAVVFAAALAFVGFEIWATGSGAVFTRPLWLDEIHTLLVAGRQDTLTSMRSLASGADFNPPTLFLLYRVIAAVTGGLSEWMMRIVATISVVATMPIVYWILRGQFTRSGSAVGAAAVWAQPVVITEAFDARFYGPWLLGVACLTLAIGGAVEGRSTWKMKMGLAIGSAFVCTIHYFGIFSWSAAILVALWWCGDRRREAAIRLLPALAGPAALGLCLPFYVGQRAALSTATWIPDVTIGGVVFLVGMALLVPPVVIALIAWGASRLSKGMSVVSSVDGRRGSGLSWNLLLAQALVPAALAVFSLLVQPATQPRYGIAAALFAAPVVAHAFSRSSRLFKVAISLSIVMSSATLVAGEGRTARIRARTVGQDIDAVSRVAGFDTLVVVRRRHSLYPILIARPELVSTAVLFDATTSSPNDRFAIVEGDVARVHRRLYGFPNIVAPTDLVAIQRFYFLEADSTRGPTSIEFPTRRITRIGRRMFRIDGDCAAGPASARINRMAGDC